MWVSPFRDLRVKGYLLLTAAYRSLSRLSSALSAKASTLRSFLFDLPVRIAFQTVGSHIPPDMCIAFIVFTTIIIKVCYHHADEHDHSFLIRYLFKDNSSDVFSYL